jgi:hypothetical protein
MIFNDLVNCTHKLIFDEVNVKNNGYRFNFLNMNHNFYKLLINFCSMININEDKINYKLVLLSLLFEYLYINQELFHNIYELKNCEKSINLLSFLNINISILKKINELLSDLGYNEYVLEITNCINKENIHIDSKIVIKRFKLSLIEIFIKILKKYYE